jgi:hypothetical protein
MIKKILTNLETRLLHMLVTTEVFWNTAISSYMPWEIS